MYIDLLIKIKNGQQARAEFVKLPYTNMDMAIAEVLEREGFIESVSKKGRMPRRAIEIKLKYENGKGRISDVKFLSKPSLRQYGGYRDLKTVKQGYGTAILSTPKGILTARDARKAKVGGALLFEIW
jgi:small subunit ribosomal protein S8